MSSASNPPPALAAALNRSLPGVTLQLRRLPGESDIELWLLSDDTPKRKLDADVARRVSEAPPYWALCWASGLVLTNHLQQHPDLIKGKVVVDFGSGSGAGAIAAAKFGAARAICVDRDPLALTACHANAAANGVTLECAPSLEAVQASPDVLMTADIFYEADNLGLMDRLRRVAPLWLAADARRRDLTRFGLDRFAVVEATTVPAFGDPQFDTVELYRFLR